LRWIKLSIPSPKFNKSQPDIFRIIRENYAAAKYSQIHARGI
jgi:hypothetical protein